jgi:hypothetical protein
VVIILSMLIGMLGAGLLLRTLSPDKASKTKTDHNWG